MHEIGNEYRRKEIQRKMEEAAENTKYINPLNVKKLLGPLCPGNYRMFSALIDNDVINFNNGLTHVASWKEGTGTDKSRQIEGQIGFADRIMKAIQHGRFGKNDVGSEKLDIEIHLRVGEKFYSMVRPNEEQQGPFVRLFHEDFGKHEWMICVPLFTLMKGFSIQKNGCMGYAHHVATDKGDFVYAGITQRNWLTRMAEHVSGINKGERKLFYNAWREFMDEDKLLYASELLMINEEFDDIMDWEEIIVDDLMAQGIALNVIPGGFKGIRELHKLGLLAKKDKRNLDAREKAINAFQRSHPRAGIPNILIRELWEDDTFAAKVICSHPDRLSIEQIQEIRRLAMWDIPIEKIFEKVKARNIEQVQRVLAGKTYSRIH